MCVLNLSTASVQDICGSEKHLARRCHKYTKTHTYIHTYTHTHTHSLTRLKMHVLYSEQAYLIKLYLLREETSLKWVQGITLVLMVITYFVCNGYKRK